MLAMRKLPVVPICRNPSALSLLPNQRQISPHPASTTGAYASSRTLGGMRWTRVAACDERCQRGRPRRVVLAPRRWCQVLKKLTLLRDDGGNKARSPRRARYTPLKPLRGECRVNRCDRGDYARMLILFCMRGCGRIERPAFPAPSASGGTMFVDASGAIARRERKGAW